MIVELGNFSYRYGNNDEWYALSNRFKTMALMISNQHFLYLDGLINEEGERVVLWLLPFSTSLESFKKCLEAIQDGMLCNYDSNNIVSLREEAIQNFHDKRWNKIDEIVKLYTFTINGEKRFAEIFNESK